MGSQTRAGSAVPVMKELFDVKTSRIPIYPHNLEHLISRLPSGTITTDELVNKHTFFPLERLVTSKERACNLLTNIKRYKNLPKISNSHTSLFVYSEIHFCPKCLEEDLIKYGECYIHRSHQLRYINICSKHKCYLISRCPICLESLADSRRFDMHNAHCGNGHNLLERFEAIKESNPIENIKLEVAKDIDFILNNISEEDHNFVRDRYKDYLINKGYIFESDRYSNKKFAEFFISKYPPDLFEALGISIYNVNNYLPQGLIDLTAGVHNYLILNILVMQLFAGTARNFFLNDPPMSACEIPFGNGPWMCRNKVCPDYNKPKIISCTREAKKINGINGTGIRVTFECPVCGYKYARYFHSGKEIKQLRILSYGELWEKELIKVYTKTQNVTVTAKIVGVNTQTAFKYLERLLNKDRPMVEPNSVEWIKEILGVYERKQSLYAIARQFSISTDRVRNLTQRILELLSSGLDKEKAIQNVSNILTKKTRGDLARQQILALINNYENISRVEIHQKMNNKYKWLLKHDSEWLNSILPPVQQGGFKKYENWSEIDRNLATKVNKAYYRLIHLNPRRRITKNLISKELTSLDRCRITKESERVPKSFNLLKSLAESKEDYQIRLLSHVADILIKKKVTVNINNTLKLEQYKGCSDLVLQHLEEYFLQGFS